MSQKIEYVVRTRIENGPEVLVYGDPISLTAKEAEPLLAVKAIELPGAVAAGTASTLVDAEPSDTSQLVQQLAAAEQALAERDEELLKLQAAVDAANINADFRATEAAEIQTALQAREADLQAAQTQLAAALASQAETEAKAAALQATLDKTTAVLTPAQVKALKATAT